MNTLGTLPGARIELDSEVAHPPFAISIGLPTDYILLDTQKGTWRRSAERMVREAFGGGLRAAERRSALAVLENLVVNCQRGGAALSAIWLGRLADGQLASAGLHLAWAREKATASLGRIHAGLSRNGTATETDTGVGPGLLHRSRSNVMVPGTDRIVSVSKFQLFVPFPDTRWTAIISTSSAFPELTPILDRQLVAIAATIGVVDPDDPAAFGLAVPRGSDRPMTRQWIIEAAGAATDPPRR